MANAIPGVVAAGVEAAKDPRVAAIIVAAFSDPGLAGAARQRADAGLRHRRGGLPRSGARWPAVRHRHGHAKPGLIASFEAKAEALGFGAQYRGTRVTPGDPTELGQGSLSSWTPPWPRRWRN